MNKLMYITYQNFPDYTANSLQTISNINKLVELGVEIDLIFPLRKKDSSDNLIELQDFYFVKNNFTPIGIKHNYPFGKISFFNKFFFHISHFLWSKSVFKKYKNQLKDSIIFTRSDWIFYFCSKHKFNVTFECHSLTKLRKYIIKRSISNKNSKIIFLHDNLLADAFVKKDFLQRVKVIHNGFDEDYFYEEPNKEKFTEKLIFNGNITRHGKLRNFEYIFDALNSKELSTKTLEIYGANEKESEYLNSIIQSKNVSNVKIFPYLKRNDIAKKIRDSDIGLLINNSDDHHAKYYSSPLKYFEYLGSGLNVLAVNLPAHENLPFSEHISFFEEDDIDSFIKAVIEIKNFPSEEKIRLEEFSSTNRAKSIVNFIFD